MRNAVAPTQSLCDVWLTQCKNKAGNISVNSQRASGRHVSCLLCALPNPNHAEYLQEWEAIWNRLLPLCAACERGHLWTTSRTDTPESENSLCFSSNSNRNTFSLKCVAGQIDGHPLRRLRSKMQRCAPHDDEKQTVSLAELPTNTGKKEGTSKPLN